MKLLFVAAFCALSPFVSLAQVVEDRAVFVLNFLQAFEGTRVDSRRDIEYISKQYIEKMRIHAPSTWLNGTPGSTYTIGSTRGEFVDVIQSHPVRQRSRLMRFKVVAEGESLAIVPYAQPNLPSRILSPWWQLIEGEFEVPSEVCSK